MTQCAVCDGAMQPAEKIDTWHQGERYEFCSDECKTVFESGPEQFVNATA